MTAMPGLESCSVDELAMLVREYLMAGHLIDRAGMPHVMAAFGEDGFGAVAIEEWMGASPVYTKRMQQALGFEGDSVETIFKGMQFDVGAPHQFLDFRYQLVDHDHGEFWLDHCGALADVEPMGETLVFTMCHDIEDPTFDATAIATNPRAQVRPIHRPPRVPADRAPVCHWTVTIAADHEPVPTPPETEIVRETRAATVELSPIDHTEPGQSDYSGPLLADLRLSDWSASALRRIAEEVCLQGHLLSLSFAAAIERRVGGDGAADFVRHQFTGAAGVAAERLGRALGLDGDVNLGAAARLLALHPAFLPRQYVALEVDHDGDRLTVRLDDACPAMADGGWRSLLDAEHLEPLDAIVRAVDARYSCVCIDDAGGLTVDVVVGEEPASRSGDVELAAISTGSTFEFADRGVPVEVRPSAG